MSRLQGARAGDDAGFSLIELVVAIAIVTLIIGPLTGAMIIGFQTFTSSTSTLYVSHDRQLLQTYFSRDAASATTATVGKTGTCAPTGVTVTNWVADLTAGGAYSAIASQGAGGFASSYEAAYGVITLNGKPTLQRWFCSDGVLTSTLTIANSLSATSPVSATCTPAPVSHNCDPSGSTDVTLAIDVVDATGVSYTVAANQRVLSS